MKNKRFDYIIAGAGAAGLTLAYLLKGLEDKKKSILILDKDAKSTNDRTWCFWEKDLNLLEDLVFKSWSQIRIATQDWQETYDLSPYVYKMIRGIDFYDFMKAELDTEQITWLQDEVTAISADGIVSTKNASFEGSLVFDSIFDPQSLQSSKANTLLQHFSGKIIETPEPVFDAEVATYMDFQVDQENDCRFGYILPFNGTTALVEYTLFNKSLMNAEEYETRLNEYIKQLGIDSYQVKEEEYGVIPMTDHSFRLKESNKVYNIGIKGGFAKASTGYTFLRSQKILKKMAENIAAGHAPDKALPHQIGRFKKYDATLLDVLSSGKYTGAEVFGNLFQKNGLHAMLSFLDEETSLKEELSIMSSTPVLDFGKSFVKSLIRQGRS